MQAEGALDELHLATKKEPHYLMCTEVLCLGISDMRARLERSISDNPLHPTALVDTKI
jgi:hypothetical protein